MWNGTSSILASPKNHNSRILLSEQGPPGGSVIKNLPADVGDIGLIPVSGRSPGEGNYWRKSHSSILAWKIPWTGEPGRLQSMGSQKKSNTT